jgi:hypothetical protein
MKTTFDLPDLLVRQAKALAAEQGRPLRDLVAEAITEKLAAQPKSFRATTFEGEPNMIREEPRMPYLDGREALRAALVEQADGSYVNVLGIDDKAFFDALDDLRARKPPQGRERLFDDAA